MEYFLLTFQMPQRESCSFEQNVNVVRAWLGLVSGSCINEWSEHLAQDLSKLDYVFLS